MNGAGLKAAFTASTKNIWVHGEGCADHTECGRWLDTTIFQRRVSAGVLSMFSRDKWRVRSSSVDNRTRWKS